MPGHYLNQYLLSILNLLAINFNKFNQNTIIFTEENAFTKCCLQIIFITWEMGPFYNNNQTEPDYFMWKAFSEQKKSSECTTCQEVEREVRKPELISQWVYELIIQSLWICLLLLHDIQWSDQVTILHMPSQLSCHGMCKIVTWWDHPNHNNSKENFQKISILKYLWNGSLGCVI